MLRVGGKIALIFLLSLTPLLGFSSLAQEALAPRLQIGINLLPAMIAANNDLAKSDPSKPLPIYLVYREDRYHSERLKQLIGRIGTIRKRKLDIKIISLDELLTVGPELHSTVFISEPLDSHLPELVEFSQQQRFLLFSPFKGDVERGVTAGFQVTDKVLPMVNMDSLKLSKIQLKAFFLRIAVKHE